MTIETFIVTPFGQNARVIKCERTGATAVIDPGGDIELITNYLTEHHLVVEAVVLTHSHIDHAGGVAELLTRLERSQPHRPRLYGHEREREMRATIEQQALYFGLSPEEYRNAPEPEHYFVDNEMFELGELQAKVLYTPGHSPGHIALYFEQPRPVVISGDCLFAGSIGRTDLPGGDFDTLLTSIQEKLLTLPENTEVMSGHGPNTTIGLEKRTNPFLR